jgi:hypothetical protein
MFFYLFIIAFVSFMCFMLFMIKSAPYRYEDSEGIHFFKNLDEMKDYLSAEKPSTLRRQS